MVFAFAAILTTAVWAPAGSAFAATIEVIPSNPTDQDMVELQINGTWNTGCTPQFEYTSVNESHRVIQVDSVSNPGCSICTSAFTDYEILAPVGQTLSPGLWQVQFRVRECEGPYDVNTTTSFTVTQSATVPVASFTWTPSPALAGETVSFEDTSTGEPTSWSWQFGDGATSDLQSPDHVFEEPGTYTVSLTVANTAGSDTRSNDVVVPGELVASFSWQPQDPVTGEPVRFTDTSTGAPTAWSWDFGDGGTSSEPNPTHTFASAGDTMVTLTVNNDRDTDTTTQTLFVEDYTPPVDRGENQVTPPDAPVGPETASATDRTGNRVVVWQGRSEPKSGVMQVGEGVFGRYFDPSDRPVGGVFEVAAGVGAGAPTVSFDGDGDFVVGWQQDGPGGGIFGRSFGADLNPMTGPFEIDDGVDALAEAPQVAAAAAGDFVTVWRQGGGKTLLAGEGIFGRSFQPDGSPRGASVRLDDGSGVEISEPAVATTATGDTVVVWQQTGLFKQAGEGVFGRYLDPRGTPRGDQFAINDPSEGEAADPSVGVDAAGNVVVVWSQTTGAGEESDIFGRLIDRSGRLQGGQFQINTTTAARRPSPSVAANAAGDFVVAWESDSGAIQGRFFDGHSGAVGPEFVMVETSQGMIPSAPATSLAIDDTATVSYTRVGDDGAARGVFVRAFELTSPATTCTEDSLTSCLNNERFEVEVRWRDFEDTTGAGRAVPLTDDTGYYWFFNQSNVELMVKVLDGTAINDHFWVFYGSLSNIEYTIVITDTVTGNSATYFNPAGSFASVGDSLALPGDGKGVAAQGTFMTVPPQSWDGTTSELDLGADLQLCIPNATTLCLNNSRFKVDIAWSDFTGGAGTGVAVPLTGDTGYFWFFDQANVEVVVKVLDGRELNGHFWVFFGALTNVEYTLTVTDTVTGVAKRYVNTLGSFGSVGDTTAF